MAQRIFIIFAVITPIIVFFSGMAMAPLLIMITLLILFSTPRIIIAAPHDWCPNYQKLLQMFTLLLAMPLLTAIWSITPEKSFSTSARVAALCITGLTAFIYVPAFPRPGKNTIFLFAFSFILVSFLIIQELFTFGIIEALYRQANIPFTRFMDKNVNRGLCALSVLIWPMILGLYLTRKPLFAWAVFLLLALAVQLMHSLSAKVGLYSSAIAFLMLRHYPITVGRMIMVAIPLFIFAFPILFMLLEKTFFTYPMIAEHLPASGHHRLQIWHTLIEQISQKPWFGWGSDTTRAMPLTPDQLSFIDLETPPLHPHSPSLQLLLETGIIGFLLSISGIALMLREWARMPINYNLHRASAGAMIVAYVASGVSSFGIWQHWWIATLWIAAIYWRWIKNESLENTLVL